MVLSLGLDASASSAGMVGRAPRRPPYPPEPHSFGLACQRLASPCRSRGFLIRAASPLPQRRCRNLPTLSRLLLSFVAAACVSAQPTLVHAWPASPIADPFVQPVDDIDFDVQLLDPHTYLYQQAPDLAPRLDCIISLESGWDPNSQNRRSRASGLAQFLPSTWAMTPEGQSGASVFEPFANIDAAIWLARTHGWTQWQGYFHRKHRG